MFTIVFTLALHADEFTFTTPGGSFSLQVTESSQIKDGKTNTGTVIDNIAMKLEELENNYITKLGRLDQARAKKLIEEIFALLVLIPDDTVVSIEQMTTQSSTTSSTTSTAGLNINLNITESNTGTPIPTPPAHAEPDPVVTTTPEPARKAMSSSDFERLISNVEDESFSDDQLRIIRLSARSAYYTVDQIVRMIGVLTFSEDQIEALRIMYDRVTDPQNAHNIPNAFTFSEDKAAAERIISK